MNYYEQIFKRKSFHLFRGGGKTTEEDLKQINEFIEGVTPLFDDIKIKMVIVPEKETTCCRGADYCILFYSETKGEYLRNIGYIGEQIDLFVSSINVGALWYGIGKPKVKKYEDLDYVIMIAFKRMPEDSFRKDMFKAKRKAIEEIWVGEDLDIANIVRFSPSACNTQPWFVMHRDYDDALLVFRYKKVGKRGIMPTNKVMYYNKIDIGIFLFILEVCLKEKAISFTRKLYVDTDDSKIERIEIAIYRLER